MTIADVNALDRQQFVAAFEGIFEHSTWVAERAFDERPFASRDDLHRAMTAAVHAATTEEQLALLRAHPDLGARARMSDASSSEQAGAGLDRLAPGQFERLQQLNARYRVRFDFPFLYAVKGSTVEDILAALEGRLESDWRTEFDEALRQVARIARFRLTAAIDE